MMRYPCAPRAKTPRLLALALVAVLLGTSLSAAFVPLPAVEGQGAASDGSRAASSPDEWLTFKADDARTGESASEAPSVGKVLWSVNYPGTTIYSSPTVWNGTVYIGTGMWLRAIWAKNGTERWTYTAPNPIKTSPAIYDGIIYCGCDDFSGRSVVAVDARSGNEVWNASVPDFVTSTPVVVGSYVYAGCQNGILYCIDKADGSIIWTFDAGGQIRWGALAYASGKVIFGIDAPTNQDGRVWAVNAITGKEDWNATVIGSVWSAPAVSGGSVLVGTAADKVGTELGNGYVYSLSLADGSMQWRSENIGSVYASPSVAGSRVFVGTYGKFIGDIEFIEPRMWCLDPGDTGRALWSNTTMHGTNKAKIWSSVTIAGTKILFGDSMGYVNAWSILGRPIWSTNIGDGSAVQVTPAVADEQVYAATLRGDVVAFGSQPDLMVQASGISVSDEFPHLGQRVAVSAHVFNIGDKTATGRVFLYNGSLEDWDTVIASATVTIEPGRSTTVPGVWTADAVGNRAVWARIMDVVPNEADIGNNEAKRVLEVLPPSEGWLLCRAGADGTAFVPTDAPTNNVTKWLWAAGGTPGRGLAATQDLVLFPVSDRIVAMNRSDGTVEWSSPLGSNATTAPGVGDGAVFVGTRDGTLVALDLDEGSERFVRALDGAVTAGPLVVGWTVYVGTDNATDGGTLYALDTFDGRVLWSRPMGAAVNAQPALWNGHLFALSDLGAVQSLDPATGTLQWQFPAGTAPGGSLTAAPIVRAGRLYVSSSSGFVYCLDADPSDAIDEGQKDVDGSPYDLVWTYRDNEHPLSLSLSGALVDGLLVLVDGRDGVIALNATGGTVAWRVRVETTVPIATDLVAVNGSIVVGGSAIDILSAVNGSSIWNYDRPLGTLVGSPAATDGMLFIADSRSIVYAFGKVRNIPPVARIKGPQPDSQARINESITFDATTSTDDKPIPEVGFHWDFGDGNSSLARVTSHAYAVSGTYIVTLSVTDTDGALDNTTVTVQVMQNHAPTLDLAMVSPGQGWAQDTIFNFSVRYTDPDGDPPKFITMRLANESEYQKITLGQVDPDDANYSDGKLYSVPKTLGSRPYPGVQFEASDGISTTEVVIAGPRVLITRTFPNNVGDIEVTVTYVGPNELVFEPVVSPPIKLPTSLFPIGLYFGLALNTTYLQEAQVAINYTFHEPTDFNLSTLSVYKWTLSGSDAEWKYIISSRVDLARGVITAEIPSLQSDIYTVLGNKLSPPANRPPNAVIEFQSKTYRPGQSVDFDGSGSYDPDEHTLNDRVVDWDWDFGDGTPVQKGKNASHVFSNEGVYTVTLSVTDGNGEKNETRVTVTVRAAEEATVLLYLALIGIAILIILLFYPKSYYRNGGKGKGAEPADDLGPEGVGEGTGGKAEPPSRNGAKAPPPNEKPSPGKEKELDDIIDELEEDREDAPKG
jgi:outer membrane protein assembly factor BamB